MPAAGGPKARVPRIKPLCGNAVVLVLARLGRLEAELRIGNLSDLCNDRPTMANWIDDKERELRNGQQLERQRADLQVHKARIVEAKGREVLDALVNVVRRDVDRYKEKFKSDADRQVDFSEKPPGDFEVYKSVFPAASVKCSLDLSTQAIVAHYAFTRDRSRPPRERWQRIELRVDAADNIELRSERRHFSNLDEVSQFLLEPVLFPSGTGAVGL